MKKLLTIIGISVFFVMISAGAAWEDAPKTFINFAIYEMNRNELSQVLDYCNSTGFKDAILYNYSNETHSIDNNTCKWKEHVTDVVNSKGCPQFCPKDE